MVSTRCKIAVRVELKKLGLHFIVVDLGEVEIMETLSNGQREQLKEALHNSGLELMDDKRAVLIEFSRVSKRNAESGVHLSCQPFFRSTRDNH